MTKDETMAILEKFFYECLHFRERELNVDSDLSREAYINAIEEIPSVDPNRKNGQKLNPEWVAEFRRYRLMDCWGKEWEKHL